MEESDPAQPELDLRLKPQEIAQTQRNVWRLGGLIRRLGRSLRHLNLWLVLTLASLGAGVLTVGVVSRVSPSESVPSSIEVEIFVAPDHPLPAVPFVLVSIIDRIYVTIELRAKAGELPLIAMNGIGGEDNRCSISLPQGAKGDLVVDLKASDVEIYPSLMKFSWLGKESEKPPPNTLIDVTMICRPHVTPLKETFIDRNLVVEGFSNTDADPIRPPAGRSTHSKYLMAFSVESIQDHEGFHTLGGAPPGAESTGNLTFGRSEVASGTARVVGQDSPQVTAAWRDTEAAMQRDIVLIVVGAVFGLAGAFFVEWIKSLREHTSEG